MAIQKINQRWLDARKTATLAKEKGTPVFVYDDEVVGFGVKLSPGGKKSFFFEYWLAGRSRRMVIAESSKLTVEKARDEARILAGQVAKGGDPASLRANEREIPNLKTFAQRYLDDYAVPKKKPSSVHQDRANLRLHVLPKLGSKRLDTITPADITKLHVALGKRRTVKVKVKEADEDDPAERQVTRGGPILANRVLALLNTMFNLAEKWAVLPRGSNPCFGVEKFKEERRERLLSIEELNALGTALRTSQEENQEPLHAIEALRLLLVTGCRRNEILTLKWAHVDLDRGLLLLPDSKTGAKEVVLPPVAVAILSRQERVKDDGVECEYVFPSEVKRPKKPRGHFSGLARIWERIRTAAGVPDVRLHDLRHAYASTAVMAGVPLATIGKILGHKNQTTTERYAHHSDGARRDAALITSTRIQNALDGKDGAEVVSFKKNS